MAYELIACAYVRDDHTENTINEIEMFFRRWNEALGNPWPDLVFKPNGKDGRALVYRAHLIGQTEWSVAALIQAVLVSGRRWPQVKWAFQSPLWGGHEFAAVAGHLEGTQTDHPVWQLLFESCLEDPWANERDSTEGEVPSCFGLFHSTSDTCVDCPVAARCLARQHQVHIRLGKTANTSGQTIRPHRRPRCWLPAVGTRLTAEHKGNCYEAVVVECPGVPLGRAILFHGEIFRSLTAASRSVAPHHNTGLTFWHWNGNSREV
ncbi:hypothetical protein FJY63_00040 [Candidatus Sumerlaeota bacterium]|nr:hypothetical protein [Candidatus Sumerlaeota bacterium]